ncbi:Os11g0695400 [Oryza sativa Japonica Group]|uniref:Os11g0695400 protein n=1 Tax=Oryza sativa subsp. japonica TaxID=39947 RepID=A0A0P0Y5N2_ORYSJ|nr:Os11g0695400 [Oryza sativa Japonica Group]
MPHPIPFTDSSKSSERERERERCTNSYTQQIPFTDSKREQQHRSRHCSSCHCGVVAVAEPPRHPSLVPSTATRSGSRVVGQHHHHLRAFSPLPSPALPFATIGRSKSISNRLSRLKFSQFDKKKSSPTALPTEWPN